ncbi:MAG: histidine--tRNA ligase [Polyangiaceae bacterium]|nr:histidine--tRNA ligase [Polyangiaceae bacterium]
MKLRAVRGMNDILPDEIRGWHRVERAFQRVAVRYGYEEVRTPLIENTALFERQIGETTDVVEKEMYSFQRHDDRLTVRPEGTAGAARAYVEHGTYAKEPISRWYYLGPMFRGERPAKGRYRQFYQLGCELFGDPGPVCDAEMIELQVRVLAELGIKDVAVYINSLGSGDTRARYKDALLAHFSPRKDALSEDSQRRLEKNPLRILDSKDPKDHAAAEGAPTLLDVLSEEDRAHFAAVQKALDALSIPYTVDTKLVRGLDYYTRTLWEIKATSADLGAQSTLSGGGRYDNMVEELGGPKTPAIGFAMGIERLLVAMGEIEAKRLRPQVFVAVFADSGLAPALGLASALRGRDAKVEVDARDSKLKAKLRRAEQSGARLCVLAGGSEIERGVFAVKDLAAHAQDEIPIEGAANVLFDRLQSFAGEGAS